ncbi:DsrE family protein [Desulfovibrio inopinatus]|uniref:DsrE family protein n=1 Tax=Desulfovibrio inopinatus TaxID=102109 RepID=UPI0004252C36|nr:DsrE family protein [Desulfovibrio inopinatus]
MNAEQLHILWTNDNPITSELMVMMYAKAAMERKMWNAVTVIIWGATAKFVAEDIHMQHLIAEAQEAGVEFSACETCARRLDVKEQLGNLGIELKSWGIPLTELIKGKEHLITI